MCQRFSSECFNRPSMLAGGSGAGSFGSTPNCGRRQVQSSLPGLSSRHSRSGTCSANRPRQRLRSGDRNKSGVHDRRYTAVYNCLFISSAERFPFGFGAGRAGCSFRCFRPFRVATVVPVASFFSVAPTAARRRPVTAARLPPVTAIMQEQPPEARNRPIALIKQVKLKEPAAPLASPHR